VAVKPVSLERVPPHSLDAEQSLLGAMLLSRDAIAEIHDIVKAEDFYREVNGKIFDVIMDLYNRGEPADPVTLSESLKNFGILEDVGGKGFIHTLVNFVPTAANAKQYAEIVEKNAALRGLIQVASQIAALGYEQPEDMTAAIDKAESLVFNVSRHRARDQFTNIKDLCFETWEHIQALRESDTHVTGLSTGFPELDKLTAGLQKSDLVIIAGRPSMGKTALSLNMAQHIAITQNIPVAIFSLEMSRLQLGQRLLSSEARVDASKVRTGYKLSETDVQNLLNALDRLSGAPIYIDDTPGITSIEIRAKARRLSAKYGIGLVIVDYLQLMSSGRKVENRQQEVSEISRSMKILGRELNVPIIAISQLSRGVETRGGDKRPALSDLRESGAIEQDADLVMFIYRDEVYNENTENKGEAELSIKKHRNGPLGKINLAFIDRYAKFSPLYVDEKET
jgi:replicative DNA helicase